MVYEDLNPNDMVGAFPCPVCSVYLPIREDKKGKPYIYCPNCVAQLFIRGEEGIVKFNKQIISKKAKETLF